MYTVRIYNFLLGQVYRVGSSRSQTRILNDSEIMIRIRNESFPIRNTVSVTATFEMKECGYLIAARIQRTLIV